MQNRQISSFPAGVEFTSLPNFLFTQVMPQIQDIAELKVMLYIFYILSKAKNLYKPDKSGNYKGEPDKSGNYKGEPDESGNYKGEPDKSGNYKGEYPPFVTYRELLSHTPNKLGNYIHTQQLKALTLEMEEKTLRRALDLAVNHGAILRLNLNVNGKWEEAYFANIESDREAIDNIKRGKLSVKPGNIFILYEQNIGIITPMIAEELKEAEKLYPPQWIEEAFKEAVMVNKRSWKYIARILERWASEGKDSGEYRQGIKKGSPDKYIKGKYGHLVKR